MASFTLFSTTVAGGPVAGTQSASPKKICPETLRESLATAPKLAGIIPASKLAVRPTPEMVPTGVRKLDDLTGGLPRGCLTEICGPASSGRTTLLLAALAAATQRQEVCALVDVSDTFHPVSAAAAGVQFDKLLWVRCGSSSQRHRDTGKKRKDEAPVEQALRTTDLLLQSGGFGLVIIDLGDVPLKFARRIPLASWFRFQRAIEHTPTVLLAITETPCAQSCATLLLKVAGKKLSAISDQLSAENIFSTGEGHGFSHAESASKKSGALAPEAPTHTQLLDALPIEAELLRSRLERKPVRSVTTTFTATTRLVAPM
jgi:hypothetical protein